MGKDHKNLNVELGRDLLRQSAATRIEAISISDAIVKDKLTNIRIASLFDLYQIYLPVEYTLNKLFEDAKKSIKELRPNDFIKVKDCQPSADEYAAMGDMLSGFIRKEIEARAVEDKCPGAIHYSQVIQAAKQSIASKQAKPTYQEQTRFYRLQNEIEVFYAPFEKQNILSQLEKFQKDAIRNRKSDEAEYFSEAILLARKSQVMVYGSQIRNYEHYNAFAQALAGHGKQLHKGFNQRFFDAKKKTNTWAEKQVDVLIAIRSMELAQQKGHDYIALIISDADFIPIFERFKSANQKYFLIYVKPIHQQRQELAKAYAAIVEKSNIIEIDMSILVTGFLPDMGYGAAIGATDLRFRENFNIYQALGGIMKEEYEQELTHHAQQEFERYNEWLANNPPY